MISIVLIAIIGAQVFPNHITWWIIYSVSMCSIKLVETIYNVVNRLD